MKVSQQPGRLVLNQKGLEYQNVKYFDSHFIDMYRVSIIFILKEPGMVETLSKNITRQGLTATTLNYLRVSMQEAQAKIEELPPFDAAAAAVGDGIVGGGLPPQAPPPDGGGGSVGGGGLQALGGGPVGPLGGGGGGPPMGPGGGGQEPDFPGGPPPPQPPSDYHF